MGIEGKVKHAAHVVGELCAIASAVSVKIGLFYYEHYSGAMRGSHESVSERLRQTQRNFFGTIGDRSYYVMTGAHFHGSCKDGLKGQHEAPAPLPDPTDVSSAVEEILHENHMRRYGQR